MKKQKNIYKIITRLFTNVFSIYLIFIVLAICALSSLFEHDLLKAYSSWSWIFFILAAFLGLLILLIARNTNGKKIKFKKFVIAGSVVLFIIQLIVVYGKFFIAGWDVNILMLSNASDSDYFSVYPNNLFLKSIALFGSNLIKAIPGLTDLFINICNQNFTGSKFLLNLTIQRAADCMNYVIFVIINCTLVNVSVGLTASIANKLKGEKTAKIIFVFSAVFIGLMPWILVPYSDTFAMFFTTIILYFYICRNSRWKWIGIFIACIIGFNIKPTVIFCLIAILFIEACKFIFKQKDIKNIKFKKYLIPITTLIVASLICIGLTNIIKNSNNLYIDNEKQFTSTHFLMLGLNPDSLGFWSEEDMDISTSCQTVKDREEKNIEIIKERLNNYGLTGLAKMCVKKSIINYHDGTFMWGSDGGPDFCAFQIGNNKFINWIYDHYNYFAQVLWYVVLIGCILCLLIKNKTNELNILAITLLILSIFIMIFECGSRYLIQYLPYFVILSSLGWNNFSAIIQEKLKMNN